MFAKLLKIKFSETITKPPLIIYFVLSILLNILAFALVWYLSGMSFYYNNFIYVAASFAIDFFFIFLLGFYLFLEDMLNYNDINYVSKSISKGVVASVKIFLIFIISLVKAIIDSILVAIVMVTFGSKQWEITSEVLVTLLGQIVFCLSITPLFLFIALSKKTLTFLGATLGIFVGIFGLTTISRTAMVDTSKNNSISYNKSQNKFNYASLYDKETDSTKIATEENVPGYYTHNLTKDWNSAISKVNPINDFMPSNIFFSFSEILYNAPSKYYEDIGFADKFTSDHYQWSNNRFVFSDYKPIHNINKESVFFFNPQHTNVFKMNGIELGDFIIDSMKKIEGIDWKNEKLDSDLSKIYTAVNSIDRSNPNGVNWTFLTTTGNEKETQEQLRIITSLLGLNDVAPSMFYLLMYGEDLLQKVPNILYKIKDSFSITAAQLFSALFLQSPDIGAIVKIPTKDEYDSVKYGDFFQLKYNTIYNIMLGKTSSNTTAGQHMKKFYDRLSNVIPYPFINNPSYKPLSSTTDFMANQFIIFTENIGTGKKEAQILSKKENKDNIIYSTFNSENFQKIRIKGDQLFKDGLPEASKWKEKVNILASQPDGNSRLKELYDQCIELAKNQANNGIDDVYWNPALWDNYFDPHTFASTNLFISVPYTNSSVVFTAINMLLMPIIIYMAIFCYRRTSLDSKNT